jgi:hypothetical protein
VVDGSDVAHAAAQLGPLTAVRRELTLDYDRAIDDGRRRRGGLRNLNVAVGAPAGLLS